MPATTWSTVRADLEANVDPTMHPGARFWLRVIGKALVTPQVQVVLLHRLAARISRTPLRPLAFLLRAIGVAWAGAEIHPDARFGPGLALVHSPGVVIGSGVRGGVDCRISQGVTLGEPGRGGRKEKWGFPVLGDHVTLGANVVVLGPCLIGDGAVVGANTVVTADVPPDSVVAGSPARVVRRLLPFDQDPTRSLSVQE